MPAALSIQHLSKTYSKGVKALSDVSFEVQEGEFIALLGPNGAGKSTTIGILTSLVKKTSGKVHVFGHDIDSEFPQAKMCMGVVPQEFNFSIFEKVLHIVMHQGRLYGMSRKEVVERSEFYLRKLGLWEKRNEPVRNLSGGMKRRLMIVRALVNEPKILILDEPTAGVDIDLRRLMWGFLKEMNEAGTTIILTTHYLEEAEELCDRILIVDKGRLIEDASKKTLLEKLDRETLVLDLASPYQTFPVLDGFEWRKIDATTIEVDIRQPASMNDLFSQLTAQQIAVKSMRNKANRLEELFVQLLASKETTL
jgi:ABC-2 type transport system ATP-binding protein